MPNFIGIRTKRGLRPPPTPATPPPVVEEKPVPEPPRVETFKALTRVMAPRADAVSPAELGTTQEPAPERDKPLQ